MKYKVGDKVRIRRDLVVGDRYGGLVYLNSMEKEISANDDNVFTITRTRTDASDATWYDFEGLTFSYSEEIIEGLYEPTDREKFEECMKELGRLNGSSGVWKSFDRLTYLDPDEDEKGFEEALKTVADYLFDTKKKMTKAEIEAELGYEIEIVEED